jgi:hypothetical protein
LNGSSRWPTDLMSYTSMSAATSELWVPVR